MEVVETPPFMRSLVPSAAMYSPAKFDTEQKSIYLVTPPPPGKPEYLKEHSFYDIPNTCVHEAYPGHHIHLANVNSHPSRVRALALSNGWMGIEIIEGWAHYTEEFMIDSGFHDTTEARILQIIGDIWRCCRMVIDVNIHTGVWSFEEAVDFLVEQAWMVRDAAIRELNWYTRRPTYPLSYRLGKYLIFDLKKRIKKKYGSRFTDKYFHDTIVQSGAIPFSVIDEVFTNNPPT